MANVKTVSKNGKNSSWISPYRSRWRPRERGRKGRMCRTMQGVQLPSQVLAVYSIKPTWRIRTIEYKEYHRRWNRVFTMGRTIIIEESVGDYISSLYGTHKWQIGLIIGQVNASYLCLLKLHDSSSCKIGWSVGCVFLYINVYKFYIISFPSSFLHKETMSSI